MKGKQKILKQLLALVLSLVMVSGMVTQSVQLRAISLDEIPIAEEQQAEGHKKYKKGQVKTEIIIRHRCLKVPKHVL